MEKFEKSLLVPGQVSDFLTRGVLNVNLCSMKKDQRDPLWTFYKQSYLKKKMPKINIF